MLDGTLMQRYHQVSKCDKFNKNGWGGGICAAFMVMPDFPTRKKRETCFGSSNAGLWKNL